MASDGPELVEVVPGLEVPEPLPLKCEDIPHVERIGGKPNEDHEILGVPVTPEIASEVERNEAKAGHETGKGSPAARVQSAAAFNLRENIVPPRGPGDIGYERGVLDGKAKKIQTRIRIEHGARTHATNYY